MDGRRAIVNPFTYGSRVNLPCFHARFRARACCDFPGFTGLLHFIDARRESPEPTYTLYRRGIELLEDGDFEHATEPLAEAARRAPEKTSVREALGRAYYRAGRFAQAAAEFEAVVETHHVNDYAHFCLGRALSKTGQKAPRPPPPGAGLQPAPRPARLPLLPPPARRLRVAERGEAPASQLR